METGMKVAALVAAAVALTADAAKLEDGTRVVFDAVLPEKEKVTVSLGRGRERLEMSSRGNAYPWSFLSTDGSDPRIRAYPGSSRPNEAHRYWWENCDYTPNGRYRRSFSTSPAVADWSETMQSERWQTSDRRTLRFAVELSGGWLSFFVDGRLLHALKASADVAGRELLVKGSKGAKISEQSVKKAVASFPGEWRVPLAAPVDVGKSWVREACVNEYGAPNNGTFGGRWAGALSATPCRLQYRVPNRRWGELRLVASCCDPKRSFLTVQFYRPGSGFPIDFAPAEPIPADGRKHVVRVPLRQDLLAAFADREIVEFELTGNVENFKDHPEPSHFSRHGVGLPSGVTVHEMTLVESRVEIDFEPEAFGNLWVDLGVKPSYMLKLRQRPGGGSPREVKVALSSRSRDGRDETRQETTVSVPGSGEASLRLEVPVSRYGWHSVSLDVDGERYERSLVVIRRREYKSRPFDTKGFMFGGWPPGAGVHFGLPAYDACRIAFKLGIESFSFGNVCKRADIAPLAEKYGVKDFSVAQFNSGRPVGFLAKDLEGVMRNTACPVSAVSAPEFQNLFAEPGGIGRECSIAALCGAEVEPRTPEQEEKYLFFKTNILHFSETYRRVFPGKKLLMPWGSPLFTIAYLKDPETRDKFEGMAFDTAFFDRMPEGQLHSCSLYVLTLLNREWAKYRSDKPLIVSVEGPCISRAAKEALTPDDQLRNNLRCCFLLTANGVTRLFANVGGSPEVASYWGEQHYSGGALSRITLNPYPVLAANATMVRLLKDHEFVRRVPTPSLGVYALEYRNIRNGKPLHVMWCVRGRVPVALKCRQAFDVMDNLTPVRELTPDPVFVVELKGEVKYGSQTFDADEAKPSAGAVKVASLAGWRQTTAAPDDEYLNNMPDNIRRYPVEMLVARDGDRLAVTLPEGLPDRDGMPFTTTLVPPEPVVLPGRPRVIAMDVDVESADWGRVVYVLRDAKGEKFVSVGQKNTYNVDDTRCDSFFNFDGRRMVRFELPGSRPWDSSRYPGFCWWGSYGGDGVVDYPLSVEKVFVERRSKAMHVNELVEAPRRAVRLGDLYVEQVEPDSDVRMPVPKDVKRQNPLAEIRGVLEPTEITGVKHPIHYYDGTRGHFSFREVEGAVSYDVYVSLSPTGEGAILLKKGAKKSGELVNGFLAGRDNYAFIVWRNAKGEVSKPSAPFKFRLEDEFAEK